MTAEKVKRYEYFLTVLLGLFIFRVVAQFLQVFWQLPFLPPFESWQSGALPYPMLLVSQVAIILILGKILLAFRSSLVVENPKLGFIYLGAGTLYLAVMLFRLIAGFSFASEHVWLGKHIPTVFHIVLALFLITVGLFHSPHSRSIIAWCCYPFVIVSAVCFHLLAVSNGVDLLVATYVPVTIAALLIIYLEYAFPYRNTWQSNRYDVSNDASYMLLVQILLPRSLGFLLSLGLLGYLQQTPLQTSLIWPHQWPVAAQALLMLVSADFLRYWLHRLSHNWKPLWALHAVHHSPHKLYWINVARFHPFEKIIQYVFDALPFILVGISENVLALYFVFYAINGFFQHCNINLRLGALNFVVSGPELHRWHHSKDLRESNTNYGNNLIIWDLLFGTWFLPEDKQVGSLGLINRAYPLNLVSQLKTPFKKGLDKAGG